MEHTESGTFIRHVPCEDCGSSDAKSLYTSGTAYCFSCQTWSTWDESEEPVQKGFKERLEGLLETRPIDKVLRGITEETLQKFGYKYATYRGETVHVAPYYFKGQLVAQHIRTKTKEFPWLGKKDNLELFGQQLWKNSGDYRKRIIITEGEIDCMTVSQAFGNKWAVVSVPNGAQSSSKYIKQNLEFLDGYEEIVLAFDTDPPGTQAAQECALLFTPGKVKIADWSPYKDPNELLMAGRSSDIPNVIFNAKSYRPDGIKAATELSLEYLAKEEDTFSYRLPFPSLHAKMRGIRKGELTTLTAGSGIGKSTMAREIAYELLVNQGLKIGYIALEESIKKTALGLMAIHMNVPLGELFLNRGIVNEEVFKDAYSKVITTDRLFLYDHFGSLDSVNLLSKLNYLAVGCGVDFIILDHISIVVSGIEDGEERRIIDNLMTQMRALVEKTGVGMILISHLKNPPEGRSHEDGDRIAANQLRGSGSIKQLSDNIIGLERDQQGKTPNISRIRILKCRLFGEETGLADTLEYHKDTGRLLVHSEDIFSTTKESF
jgi:twinkle protein